MYQNPDKDWDYFWKISKLKNLSWKFIDDNIDKKWNFGELSKREDIDFDIVAKNFSKFPSHFLYENPSLTWDVVDKYSELPWNFDYLSGVKSITWDIVCKNKEKDWNFYIMDNNPSVTYQIFLENKDQYNWDYQGYSTNPNLSFKIITDNDDKEWDYKELSKNPMDLEKENFIRKCFQEDFMKEESIAEELAKNIFHPKNFDKFKDWGFFEEYI